MDKRQTNLKAWKQSEKRNGINRESDCVYMDLSIPVMTGLLMYPVQTSSHNFRNWDKHLSWFWESWYWRKRDSAACICFIPFFWQLLSANWCTRKTNIVTRASHLRSDKQSLSFSNENTVWLFKSAQPAIRHSGLIFARVLNLCCKQ